MTTPTLNLSQSSYPPVSVLEAVANLLGDTAGGFTGSEIGRLLETWGIEDVHPDMTKRHRLREALVTRQRRDNAANAVIRFISEAMTPVRYADDPALFEYRQDALNQILARRAQGPKRCPTCTRAPSTDSVRGSATGQPVEGRADPTRHPP